MLESKFKGQLPSTNAWSRTTYQSTLEGQVSAVTALPPQAVSHFDTWWLNCHVVASHLLYPTAWYRKTAKVFPGGQMVVQIHAADSNTAVPRWQHRSKCDLVWVTSRREGADTSAASLGAVMVRQGLPGQAAAPNHAAEQAREEKKIFATPLPSPEGSQLLCPKD